MRIGLLLCLLLSFLLVKGQKKGASKTHIMVLGTPHLNQIEGFEKNMLDGLIDHLLSYQFDAICVEGMPGQLLLDIRSRNDPHFKDLLEYFASDRLTIADSVSSILETDFISAEKQLDSLLSIKELSKEHRLSIAENSLVTTDIATALLQLEKIDSGSISRSRISELLQSVLDRYSKKTNEIYSLAVNLALHENIEKIEYIDNFQDESILMKEFPEFMEEFQNLSPEIIQGATDSPFYQKISKIQSECIINKDLVPLYQFMNSKDYMTNDYNGQWALWLRTNFQSGSDMARFYLWEMRNLQIAANILQVAAHYPRKRILVILGAAHKSFLEKYLQQVETVDLISFN